MAYESDKAKAAEVSNASAAQKAADDKKAQLKAEAERAEEMRTAAPPSTRNTIWVQCKLPHGIWIEQEVKRTVSTPAGDKVEWKPLPGSPPVLLKGANQATILDRRGQSLGYGITEVDYDLFKSWVERMGPDFGPLKSGAILWESSNSRAMDSAIEHKAVKTGFEQLEPAAPSDEPGRVTTDEAYARTVSGAPHAQSISR
jgi:hypothetical protein